MLSISEIVAKTEKMFDLFNAHFYAGELARPGHHSISGWGTRSLWLVHRIRNLAGQRPGIPGNQHLRRVHQPPDQRRGCHDAAMRWPTSTTSPMGSRTYPTTDTTTTKNSRKPPKPTAWPSATTTPTDGR